MDVDGLIKEVADIKDNAAQHMMELFAQFKTEAEKRGVHVHLASTGAEANRIIAKIAKENNCHNIIKSKSMTAEEIHLNDALEKEGCRVVETDLGEWIIQLRHEGPSHMVMPAIHLSRYQVADLFTDVTHVQQDREDIQKLVKVARKELRGEYVKADMGISGANFAVAEAGLIGTVTNEGNLRLVTTMPRVHVVLAGLEKLIPTIADALKVLQVLPRNATAQAITSYITWIAGANECATGPDGRKEMHIVFLDNGRLKIAQDPAFKDILRCVRCGACANVCPVYRLIGGHKMGYVYIGAVGLALTYLYHGADKARALVQNCIGCESCKNVCSAGIDLPRITMEIRSRLVKADGNSAAGSVMSMVMKDRDRFHSLLKFIKFSQKPLTVKGGKFIRHLPAVLMGGDQSFRQLPALAPKSFRQLFKSVVNNPRPAQVPRGHLLRLRAGLRLSRAARGRRASAQQTRRACGVPPQADLLRPAPRNDGPARNQPAGELAERERLRARQVRRHHHPVRVLRRSPQARLSRPAQGHSRPLPHRHLRFQGHGLHLVRVQQARTA